MSPLLFECLRWMPFPFSFVIVFLTFLGARLLRTSNPLAEICNDIFFNICVPFPFQNKGNWKCLLTSTNVSALCLDFADVSAILQALHTRALLSRSSGEMKLDSISWQVEADLLCFCWDHVNVFLQTTHFIKLRAHSPRPTSNIIAKITLRRAILMKAEPVVSLHANRLFSGSACSCQKDPCYGDVVYAQTWEVLTLKYYIEPP